jgi:DNA polymerase elongation subunit (family B)
MQHEVLSILAEAQDYESYIHKLEAAPVVLAGYEERLASGDVEVKDLVVSKRITKEPRDYQKAGVTAIAAQQLFGNGAKLRPGQTIEYIYTDSESAVLNDRVRAYALWEGCFGYDRKKYAAMLREAFQPFELFVAAPSPQVDPAPVCPGEHWADTPLFSALKTPRHRV